MQAQVPAHTHSCAGPLLIGTVIVRRPKGCPLDGSTARSRHVHGLGPSRLVVRDQLVFDGFFVGQGTKAFGLNGRLVDKDIRTFVVGDNETKALVVKNKRMISEEQA